MFNVINGASQAIDCLEGVHVANDAVLVQIEYLSVSLDYVLHTGHLEAVNIAPVGEKLFMIGLVIYGVNVHFEIVWQD